MNNRRAFFMAMVLHGLLLLSVLSWHFLKDSEAGLNSATIITSYFYNSAQLSTPQPVVHTITQTHHYTDIKRNSTQANKKKFIYKNTQGHDELAETLHNLIQAQQVYPQDALFAQATGTVAVSFDVTPEGHIINIHLTSSSHHESLDQAALRAVAQIDPVHAITLKTTEHFQVHLVFELQS